MKIKHSHYRRLGVTLIEAIAVILLLSAAAASSMIYLDNDFLSRRTASAATTQVGEVLLLARNTAISHQTNVHVSRSGRTVENSPGSRPHRSRTNVADRIACRYEDRRISD